MTHQEIQERNEQIALMLGWKNLNDDSFPEYIDTVGNFYPLKELKFHSDWNWLMESIKKILSIVLENDDMETYNIIIDQMPDIEAVFIAVSDFAKKFNNKEL
jgi:hypothetical protein